MPIAPPINFKKWLRDNAHQLQPPVPAACIYRGKDFFVMVVGGPNMRNDYHVNQSEEWFYQHKGALLLKIVDGDVFKDIIVEEDEMFFLPANTPHCPVRFADTVGLVIETIRRENSVDTFQWYCHEPVHHKSPVIFKHSCHLNDVTTQLQPIFERWRTNEDIRKCQECGKIAAAQSNLTQLPPRSAKL